MSKPTVFVKVSGDEISSDALVEWLKSLNASIIVICVGAGTQINDAYRKNGWEFEQHGPLGREAKNHDRRAVALDVLLANKAALEKRLQSAGVHANVIVPAELMMLTGTGGAKTTHISHANGDEMVRRHYVDFDELYVITTKGRVDDKRRLPMFEGLKKLRFVGL